MTQIFYATAADLWLDIVATGRKVSHFLMDECEIKDVAIIGVILWIL